MINPAVIKRKIPASRKIEDLRRASSAAAAVAELAQDGTEIYGLTRGQFSLTDLIEAVLERTGPAELGISTWTAANASVQTMLSLLQSGRITRCRWLVDTTFVRRVPALVAEIRRQFGADAIRVSRVHAKFCTLANADWQVALRSSMNLNQNPRMESFEVGHDPELCAFLTGVLDQVWANQPRRLADDAMNGNSPATAWWEANG